MKRTFDDVKEKRALIEEYLEKIGWKLRDHGCDHYYFYNHRRVCTGMYLLFPETDGRIQYDAKSSRFPQFTFYLKDVAIDLIDDNAVSFCGKNDKSIFILLMNHDRKRPAPTGSRKKKV